MRSPMREEIAAIVETLERKYTIREAVDWYKKVYRTVQKFDPIAETEADFINVQFGIVIQRTNRPDKLPPGPLGQFVASVAIAEYAEELVKEALDE